MAFLSLLLSNPSLVAWPTRGPVPASHCRSSSPLCMAAFAHNGNPENMRLQDELMGNSVGMQLEMFKTVGERGLQLWLIASWNAWTSKGVNTGEMSKYLEKLQRSGSEEIFVPTRSFRQGSPENPYLPKPKNGYTEEIEPKKIAEKLMTCRETLAEDWQSELELLSARGHLEGRSDRQVAADIDQLLAGLATKHAARELLREIELLPSKRMTKQFLSEFLFAHSADMERGGKVEDMLHELDEMPIRFRGSNLIDPYLLAEDLRSRRTEVAAEMADTLDDTKFEHLMLRSSFLESCLWVSHEAS